MDDAADHVVRLFQVDLRTDDALLAECRRLLSEDERQRADRLVVAEVARRFIVGRSVLRQILGHTLGLPPAEIRLIVGPHGKPALADDSSDFWQFNISHSGDAALIAVTRGRAVGVDLELRTHRLKRDELAARFFSPAECRTYFELPEAQRPAAFYRVWTCKEAYLKAIGAGLSFPLGRFTVSARSDEPPGLLDVDGQPDEPARWAFVLPEAGKDFAAALAVEGHGWTLHRETWQRRGTINS